MISSLIFLIKKQTAAIARQHNKCFVKVVFVDMPYHQAPAAKSHMHWCTLLPWVPRFGLYFIWRLIKWTQMEALLVWLLLRPLLASVVAGSLSFYCQQPKGFHTRQLQMFVSRVSTGLLSLSSALIAGWHEILLLLEKLPVRLRLFFSPSSLPPLTPVTFTWNNLYC